MTTKLTPEEIRTLRAAARAKTAAAAAAAAEAPYELTVFEVVLVAAIARLNHTGKPTTIADVLTDILDRSGTIHNVQQARNTAAKLTKEGLLTAVASEKPASTTGKAPLAYSLTLAGQTALERKTADLIDLTRLIRVS